MKECDLDRNQFKWSHIETGMKFNRNIFFVDFGGIGSLAKDGIGWVGNFNDTVGASTRFQKLINLQDEP